MDQMIVAFMKEVFVMDSLESFCISGTKDLIFRREGEEYITFNPDDLEFMRINEVGAIILYLISQEFNLQDIVNFFKENSNKKKEGIKKEIIMFLSNYECKHLITENLKRLKFGDF